MNSWCREGNRRNLHLHFLSLCVCYVCDVCACESWCACAMMCMPSHAYRGWSTTSSMAPGLPPCLRQGPSLLTCYGHQASRDTSFREFSTHWSSGNAEAYTTAPGFYMGSGNLNSSPRVCVTNPLPTGQHHSPESAFLMCSLGNPRLGILNTQ